MNWENLNTDQLPVTSVADIAVNPNNPNTLFIGTGLPDGGVSLAYGPNWASVNPIYTIGMYRSEDGGQTWHTINDGFMNHFYNNGGTIRKIEIDESNPNVLYAATSNGIFKTTNALSTTPSWQLIFDGFNNTDNDFRAVELMPGNNTTLYASSTDIFKSINSGSSWSSMTGPNTGLDFNDLLPFEPHRINLATTPADPDRLFAYIWGMSNGEGEMYIYYFDNNQWNQLVSQSNYVVKNWMAFAVSPVNPDEYYFYGSFGVYGSHNLTSSPIKYSSYIDPGVYADGHVLEFQPNHSNPKVFFGHHAGVSIGDMSSPNNWEFRNNGLENMLQWAFDDSEFEDDIIITANQDCYSYFHEDDNWDFIHGVIGDSYSARSSKTNKNLFYITWNSYEDDKLATYDQSTNNLFYESNKIPNDIINPSNYTRITKTFNVKAFPNEENDYFTFSELYKRNYDYATGHSSSDLWEVNSDIGKIITPVWKRQITEFDFCQSEPETVYLATCGIYHEDQIGDHFEPHLFKTTNGLNNGNYYGIDAFEEIDYPGTGNEEFPIISGIAVHPEDPNKVWISMIGYDNINIRVAYSNDGGTTWNDADDSNSLPELPVNNIVYQYGSNDVLYIATDVGVYYKTGSMNHWEKYGDIPNVRVTELKINYCQNTLRASTFGRSLWEADLLNSENPVCYAIKDGETIIWEKAKTLQTGLRIESGGSLVVNNTLNMPKEGKIIVEQGGELIVDGGTITNGCGQQWQGIEVWGTRSESQMPCTTTGMTCNQGYLELKNGAVIENAEIAVDLWNPDHYQQTGGIVVADSATFRNNAKSIHATHYQNFNPYDPAKEMPDVSMLVNCTFEITDEYLETTKFHKHVDLAQVYGFEFKGCDFTVDATSDSVSEFNNAIASYSAGFRVEERCLSSTQPCADMDKCTFTGFYEAVNANSSDIKSYTFHVHNAVFENNTYGISSTGVDNPTILYNEFYIGPNNTNDRKCCSSTPGTGIFMDNSSGFAIEENYFTKADGAPTGEYTGIHIKDAESVDEVYLNDFEGLSYANLAEGVNYDENFYSGLTYFCNTNTQNFADFYVSSTGSDVSIQSKQGNDYEVTGNTFSQSGATWHFYNGGAVQIGYYYCATCPDENPDDDKIYHVTDKAVSLTNDCLSHYGDPARSVSLTSEQTDEAEQDYFTAYNDFNNVETLYINLKDGGSTPAELQAVETAQPSDMWELRSQLLGDSPHLSMDVLKKTADRTDVFSDQALFDILSANPDELKKDELMKYLEEKDDPLPDYMIEILKEVAEGTTYKTVLQNQMAEHSRKKARAAMDIIRSLLNEETPDMNELRNWLDNLGGLNADRQIISTYLHEGNYTDALALADLLPGLYEMEGEALEAHNDYESLLNLYKTLGEQDRNTYQLTEDEINDLEVIAENSRGQAAAQAQGILESAYGQHFYSCTDLEGNPADKSQGINMEDAAQLKQVSVSVHPNPAQDWTTFEYQLSSEESNGVITLVNAEGKTVQTLQLQGKQGQKLVDTRKLKAGAYFYTFKTEGVVQAGKLIITK